MCDVQVSAPDGTLPASVKSAESESASTCPCRLRKLHPQTTLSVIHKPNGIQG
jgi:hypothetical protein